ncbi:MAG: hypothetical protein PSV22_01870 [Pseudolabrys sp.]|nr:hypothetical protein [Pseudolabrys sp.]
MNDRKDATPKSDQALDEEQGLRCPKCACQHFYVVWTRARADRSIRRRRECRHCGHQITTSETRLTEAP